MIQLQAINYILDSKDASFITYNNLNQEFFSDYPKEFNFIKQHISKYNKVPDKETFLSNFPDFDIIKVNESYQYIIDELYKDKNSRAMAQTFNSIRNLLLNNKVDDAMKVYSSSLSNITNNINLKAVDITTDKSRYDTYVDKSRDYTKSYIKTGFTEFDNIFGGWDRNEDYVVISARPGVGKTWLGLKIAASASEQGMRVGIYSGEMSDNMVGYRIDTLLGHISNKKIVHGDISIQNDYQKFLNDIQTYAKGPIFTITPKIIGNLATVSTLKAFIEKYKLDILIVDQHSLLEDERRGKSAVERASNISRDIKNLQVTSGIPIITLSQQNRESTENGLDTRLISQADRIGQDASIVIFIEQKDNILTLTLSKSRNSESGKKLQYAIDLDKGIFTYIPTESDALNGDKCEEIKNNFEQGEIEGEDIF